MKTARLASFLLAWALLLSSGCSALPWARPESTPQATAPAQATTPLAVQAQPTPGLTQQPTASAPLTLRVWLPPEFDPNSGTPAGELLRQRLDSFVSSHQGLQLDIRIKALDGPGGMIDALASASAAAPLALPDLVALPRPLLEDAALKGLLRPMDSSSTLGSDPDWYGYAVQLSRLQDSTFGIPFAGDALALVYRPAGESAGESTPPRTFDEALTVVGPLAFPAADSRALFTLALYLSAGGPLQDDQGHPTLEPQTLAQVFSFYQQGSLVGLLPYWLTQYETDEQSWAAFEQGQANLAVTWTSRWLQSDPQMGLSASSIPTAQGTPYTLATGWVWSLAGSNPAKQELATLLAQYLTEPDFMSAWTESAGYLPTRTSALAGWDDSHAAGLCDEIARAAQASPSADVISSLAPPIKDAVIILLKEQGDPLTLAQSTADTLK